MVQKIETSFFTQNKYWFEGAAIRIPKHNNHLEGFNGSLKVHQTFFEKKNLNEFKDRMMVIVTERSREYLLDKAAFAHEVPITERTKAKGLAYSESAKQFVSRKSQDGSTVKFYVFSGEKDRFAISEEDVDKFVNIDWEIDFDSFDEFTKAVSDIHCVEFQNDPNKWMDAVCICPAFSREFMCKHILCIAFRTKILKVFYRLNLMTVLIQIRKEGDQRKPLKDLRVNEVT